ncbi:MAG: hypothetical protein KGO48_06495 [Alphaproteobacteria bacterium]|nr:hypothetical protein [Alphaproteobacteria bacterium]
METLDQSGGETLPESETLVPATDEVAAEGQEAPADELEEVEHDGKNYKIPKALKGALLMQADYTRKTQEVAEQRRQHEERVKAFDADQRAQAEHLSDFARVVACNDAIAQFEKADWPQIRANNPQLYNDLWFQYQQTKESRDKAVLALQQKVAERNSNAQRESAKRVEEARAALARDITDWSPDLAGKLNRFAVSLGFTPEEVGQVTDPRIVKLLHAAYAGNQAKTMQAASQKAASVESAKPLSTVGGASPTRVKATETASDKLSTDEWLRRRNAELKHKRGR